VTGIAAWDAVHKIADAEQRDSGTAIGVDVPCIQTVDNAFRYHLHCSVTTGTSS